MDEKNYWNKEKVEMRGMEGGEWMGGGGKGGEHCSEILVGYCQGLYTLTLYLTKFVHLAAPFMTSNNIRQDLSTYEAKLRLGTS